MMRAEGVLRNRNRHMPGICVGAFLGFCWEAVNSRVNHSQGGAPSDKQQTSQSAQAWLGSQERVSQNRTAKHQGRRWTEAGEKKQLRVFFFKMAFDATKIEKKKQYIFQPEYFPLSERISLCSALNAILIKYRNAGGCLPWQNDCKIGALSWDPSQKYDSKLVQYHKCQIKENEEKGDRTLSS